MVSVTLSLFVAGLSFLPSVIARPSNLRRDDIPKFPYDPNTTPYCTWWMDNDGSTNCQDIPDFWAISLDDFRRWNPSITASCGGFEVGKSYCVEAYGEPAPTTTISPTSTSTSISTSTSTTQSMTTATATITTVTPPTTSGNGITTPTPTQPGMVSNCNKFYKVTDDDGCETIADKNGITLSDFYLFNTQVGTDCSTLWTDYYVCVAVIGTTTTASATITTTKATSTSTNGISTPTPTQPGMVSNCNKFYKVTDDDGCQTIADKNGITLSEFYLWNTQTGSDCSILWTDYYVCVAVIGTTTTASATTTTTKATSTSTNGISTPTPIQPGMVSNCDAFYYVQSDDVTCAQIAHDNGISLLQFYTWNPTVGADCGSLWTSYYVCISIVGVTPSPSTIATTTTKATTTTSAGNGVATPTPIQPGMTTSCKTFHKVVNGDECGAIATNAKIALANFLKWNPQVGSDCSSLWLDYYVCVGVL